MQEEVKIIFRNGSMKNFEVYIGDKKVEHLHNILVNINSNDCFSHNNRVDIVTYNSDNDQLETKLSWSAPIIREENVISLSDDTINSMVSKLGKEFGSVGQQEFEQKANAMISRLTLDGKKTQIVEQKNDAGASITGINKLIPKTIETDNGRKSN